MGRLIEEKSPKGNVTTYTYDHVGNLSEETNLNGNVTKYQYNPLNLLKQVEDALGGTTSYEYTALGILQTVTDANGNSSTYEYNKNNNAAAGFLSIADAFTKGTTFETKNVLREAVGTVGSTFGARQQATQLYDNAELVGGLALGGYTLINVAPKIITGAGNLLKNVQNLFKTTSGSSSELSLGGSGYLQTFASKGTVKGKNVVYTSTNADDVVQYVGITNNYARRAAEHLRDKGINIQPLMKDLSRSDARAVEQALIEIHGLQKNGGTLMNKINSISIKNPSYAKQLERGHELLKSIGY